MAKLKPVVFDFETEKIEDRPHYPPKPVGVSIKLPGERAAKYWAFGHPAGNNCSEADAKRALKAAYVIAKDPKCGAVCHHGKFDLDVAETHWGMPIPSWEFCHDTLFLIFLNDPHTPHLQLKPAAEDLLGMPPDERDAVREWLIAQKIVRKTQKDWGGYICKAPGDLVGKYANGDVMRTSRIFDLLHQKVVTERSMAEPYNRERQLMPFLLQSERDGIKINLPLLEKDVELYTKALGDETQTGFVDQWLQKRLKAKGLNVDSDEDLADALVACGAADPDLFLQTPSGNRSVSKKSLPLAVTDYEVLWALQYRSMLQTRLGTFLRPWYEEALEAGGRVYPHWHQVRTFGSGARSGRISASRFMNAPTGVGTSQHDDSAMLSYRHPKFIKGLPQLPQVRIYLQPDKGQVWCKRDFAQQELRILAHFEDGILLNAYQENPKLDMHQFAVEMFKQKYGIEVSRTRTKTIGFSLLYGMGAAELAQRLQLDLESTKQLKKDYMEIFAGLADLQNELKARAREEQPFLTWGGRQYFCEPPKFIPKRGRVCTFEYKMLNYLIQGSAADVTKQALVNYAQTKHEAKFLVTVHDEINISAPPKLLKKEMKILADAMADIKLDCALLSDGEVGANWAELKDYKD